MNRIDISKNSLNVVKLGLTKKQDFSLDRDLRHSLQCPKEA